MNIRIRKVVTGADFRTTWGYVDKFRLEKGQGVLLLNVKGTRARVILWGGGFYNLPRAEAGKEYNVEAIKRMTLLTTGLVLSVGSASIVHRKAA